MWISRIVVNEDGVSRRFALSPGTSPVDESPTDTERITSILRNLFLGIKHQCQLFATIDGIEFEISSEMALLMGERFRGRFSVIDVASPVRLGTTDVDEADTRAVVVRAALETIEAMPTTLDLDQIDRAAIAVDAQRDPLAEQALQRHLQRIGLRSLFARRDGRALLDPDDPAVRQLQQFDDVLADRRRQLVTDTPAFPNEYAHASMTLRDVFADASTDVGEIAAATAWLADRHARQVETTVTTALGIHAAGEGVLGSIPLVIDFRSVEGEPPAADIIAEVIAAHADALQVILVPGDRANRAWLSSALHVDASPNPNPSGGGRGPRSRS